MLMNYTKNLALMLAVIFFYSVPLMSSQGGRDIVVSSPDYDETEQNVVVSFDFNNVDLLTLVRQVSRFTGKRFVVSEDLAQKRGITIMSPEPISVQEAYDVFLSVLDDNGYAIVRSGPFLRIIQKARVTSGVTIYKGDYFPRNDQYITRLIKLENIDATNLTNQLIDRRGGGPFVPQDVKIKALEDTNTILLTGTGSQISDIEQVINILDVSDEAPQLEVIKVRNADANKMREIVENIIFDTGAARPAAPTPAARRAAPAARPGGDMRRGAERYSRIFTDDRTNSIIVLANEPGIRRIRSLVARLDFEVEGDRDIHVYPLSNARAEDLSNTLSSIIAGGKAGTAGTKDTAFEGVRITADPWTNSLVINAQPRQYEGIRSVIEGLDRRKGQVLFETITMEIAIDHDSSFGVSSNYALSSEVPRAVGFDPGVSAQNNIMNFLANPAALGGMILGFGSKKTVDVNLGGQQLKIPSLTAFITALEKNSEANVLQRPSIITSDNEPAEIRVMEKIPVVKGTVMQQGLSQQNIDFVDVGLKLNITPRINEASDFIKLDIEQETSNLTDRAPRDLSGTTVSTNSRNVKTSVVVRDGDTVILGGLYRDDINTTYNKVPILGDVPVIGWLFKGKTTRSVKTNLLMFITPNIVRDYETHSLLTQRAIESRRGFVKRELGGEDKLRDLTGAIQNKIDLQLDEEELVRDYDMPETGVKMFDM